MSGHQQKENETNRETDEIMEDDLTDLVDSRSDASTTNRDTVRARGRNTARRKNIRPFFRVSDQPSRNSVLPSHLRLSQLIENESDYETDKDDSSDTNDRSSDASSTECVQVSSRSRNMARRANRRPFLRVSDRPRTSRNSVPPSVDFNQTFNGFERNLEPEEIVSHRFMDVNGIEELFYGVRWKNYDKEPLLMKSSVAQEHIPRMVLRYLEDLLYESIIESLIIIRDDEQD